MKPGFQLPPDAPAPRSCLIKKQHAAEEYGYNLHAERGKGQFIGAVDDNSPASRAGLRPGDHIFAVNGTLIAGESHRSVVSRIKEHPLQCELLVLTEDGANWYQAHGISVSGDLSNVIHLQSELSTLSVDPYELCEPEVFTASTSVTFCGQSASSRLTPSPSLSSSTKPSCESPGISGDSPISNWYTPKSQAKEDETESSPLVMFTETVASNGHMNPRPRMCTLEKSSPIDEFGFNLHAERNRGHFVGAVDYEGIGFHAGLVLGQRIVGVNGELIYPDTAHKKVVALIKQDPLKTQLLVASEEVDRWYAENKIAYSFDNAIIFRDTTPNSSMLVQAERPTSFPDEQIPEPPSHSPPASVISEEQQSSRVVANEEHLAPTPALQQEDIMEQVFSSVSLTDTKAKSYENESGCVKRVHEIVVGADAETERQAAACTESFVDSSSDNRSTTKSVSSRRSDKETVEVADVAEDRPKLDPYFTPSPVTTPVSNGSKVASVTPISRATVSESNSNFTLSSKSVEDDDPSLDIFKMSASEARARLKNRKKDQRKGCDMTLDEKHRLIANM